MSAWSKVVAAIALTASNVCVHAALDVGESAPKFTTQAAIAGNVIKYSLADELKKGPVVLYFFPLAFSEGCSIEAHDFAEAIDGYAALGATVIGVSRDDIDTQKKFSVSECRGKFAVASDADQSIMKSYDAVLFFRSDYANRVSFVISPAGKIIYQYNSLNPAKHVANTMAALKSWHDFGVVK
ncbi:MAG: peroxiredoxin [Rhodoferax sp.]